MLTKQPKTKQQLHLNLRWLFLVGVFFLTASYMTGCFETIKSSQDLACDKASDCWDGLPCVENVCGGKPTPKQEPKPLPDGNETQPEQLPTEAPTDIACPVPQGAIFLCRDNASCKSNKCNSFKIPGCAKESKACICQTKTDCKTTESCCTFGTTGICSPFPCKKP